MMSTVYSSCRILSLARARLLSSCILDIGSCGSHLSFAEISQRFSRCEKFVNFFETPSLHLRNEEVSYTNHHPVDGAINKANFGTQCGVWRVEQIRNCERGDKCGDDGNDGC